MTNRPSRRGFIAVWFKILLGYISMAATGGATWYRWQSDQELPLAEAAMKSAGYPLDLPGASAPDVPDGGNFGAAPPLRGLANEDATLTPGEKGRIAAIRELSLSKRTGQNRNTSAKALLEKQTRSSSPGSKETAPPAAMPVLDGSTPVDWKAWSDWMARGLRWEMPEDTGDAKAVLAGLEKKTAQLLPELVAAAQNRKSAAFIPSQRFRMAAAVQRGDVTIDFASTGSRLMPLCRVLVLQMEAALACGKQTQAAEIAPVLFALRDLHAHENSLINYLVRVSLDRMLIDAARRSIAAGVMHDALLALYQQAFPPDDPAKEFERAMVMEVAFYNHMITKMEEGRGPLDVMEHIRQKPAVHVLSGMMYRRTRAARIQWFLGDMEALRAGGMIGYQQRSQHMEASAPPGWLRVLKPHEMLARGSAAGFSALVPGLLNKSMHRRFLLVACAMERHRLAGGAPPDSLTMLPAGLLPQIPEDLDGKPLRYRREGTRWVLWSVAMNLVDDWHGTPPPREQKGRTPDDETKEADWLWQSP